MGAGGGHVVGGASIPPATPSRRRREDRLPELRASVPLVAAPLVGSRCCWFTGDAGGALPPQTTLSRAPLGHSCEPRDFSLPLRRSSPEDTGLGRERTPRTALSARQRPESAPPLLLVGIRWKCEVSPRGEAGGVGGLPPRPVSSGEHFRSARPECRGSREWPRGARLSAV